MPESLRIALPIVMAAVVLASGISKLRTPDDLAGWAELGIPAALRRPRLLALHPWAEIALGLALLLLGGVLGVLAALANVALMVVYLVLVWRVTRRTADASCACFGARKPVTVVTVFRNAWLSLLAVATAVVVAHDPLWGGALAAAVAAPAAWGWLLGAAVAAVTVGLILWPEEAAPAAAAAASATAGSVEEEDYVRTRTPAAPVTLADGTVADLRTLSRARPVLLLAVSETCGSCGTVIDSAPRWRELLPEVDVRLLLRVPPEASGLTDTAEPQTLHDEPGYVSASISDWPTPAAVLLGVDGMLAGGPEIGGDAIEAFVRDIRAALDGEL